MAELREVITYFCTDGQEFDDYNEAYEHEILIELGQLVIKHMNSSHLDHVALTKFIFDTQEELAKFFGWKDQDQEEFMDLPHREINNPKKDTISIDSSWALTRYDVDKGAKFERKK